MKILAIIFTLLFVAPASVYDFKLKNIDGKDFDLSQYKGKKVLIVNTASKCGFTPQYADLQKLADTV
jgi:glutathione peroxidase